ncbi:MAG: esterase-like activity of phytase family protein [Planctomyces sp.]|nr:esterase-like activity of phytase family protein [Planctomyces sp.]
MASLQLQRLSRSEAVLLLIASALGIVSLYTLFHFNSVGAADRPLNPGELAFVPRIELIGTAEIPGDQPDLSGDQTILENGELAGRIGGFSAIDATENPGVYRVLPDRGPDDGATSYRCRSHLLKIQIDPQAVSRVNVELLATEYLTDELGRGWYGSSTAPVSSDSAGRLDPEGLRTLPGGRFLLSDEYGPSILEFASNGRLVRSWQVPQHMQVEHPAATKQEENALNQRGRASNKGIEGLAVSHDGQFAVGLFQQALLQDSVRSPEKGTPSGNVARLLVIDRETQESKEYLYELESSEFGTNEILAAGPDQYLVIEKDGLSGNEAAFRKLMLISTVGATDVTGMDCSFAEGIPSHVKPVTKTEFLDFLNPAFGLAGDSMPEKIEGLTWGPPLADGRKTLIVVVDNDFEYTAPSRIWVFAL